MQRARDCALFHSNIVGQRQCCASLVCNSDWGFFAVLGYFSRGHSDGYSRSFHSSIGEGAFVESNIMKEAPALVGRWHVVARGALWALVYNLVWCIAWFAFMRAEWHAAATATGRAMPWTADIWIVWGILTFPLGAAIVAYAISPQRSARMGALRAGVAMWAVLSVGMAISCSQFSPRVIVLDLGVNLIAMLAASIIAVLSPPPQGRQKEPKP